jgi:hypothetical protein
MNLTKYILDANGQPQPEGDLLTWAQWMGTGDNQILKREQVRHVRVSTIFRGLSHGLNDTEPVLFETMVFGGKLDGLCERYASRADALSGHANVVARVSEAA